MGNSSSHSVQLAQTRLSLHSGEKQKTKKYACPVNKVLPIELAAKQLRSTDNGSILHSGGTISKRNYTRYECESEFSKLLQNSKERMTYGHRKSYSDPDVLRLMMNSSVEEEVQEEQEANRRSIIAISPSKAKIKSKKRNHAPDPPRTNTLPKDINKSCTSNYTSIFQKKNSVIFAPQNSHPEDPKDGYKSVRSNYEEMRWEFDKWKIGKCTEGHISDRERENRTSFDKRERHTRRSEGEFAEDKQKWHSGQRGSSLKSCLKASDPIKNSDEEIGNSRKVEHRLSNGLKRYYFDDVDCLKSGREHQYVENKEKYDLPSDSISPTRKSASPKYTTPKPHLVSSRELKHSYKRDKCNLIVSQSIFSQSKELSESRENSSNNSISEEELEGDIELQLRPTLPKRQTEIAKFSPAEIWKSIVVDLKSQQTYYSSDEDVQEERIQRTDKPVAPKRFVAERYEYSGDTDPQNHQRKAEGRMEDPQAVKQLKNIAWVPQQDLADDSDGEEGTHKLHSIPQVMSVQAKFILPNSMFPGQKSKERDENSRTNGKNRGKKGEKNSDHFSSLRNLRKALGFRGKSPVDEQRRLDTNWSLSRSLPDFLSRFHFAEKSNGKLLLSSPEGKGDSAWQNSSLSTPSLPTEHEDKIKENSTHYSQYHVMYLPEYISGDAEKCEVKKKTFTYQSTIRKVERKLLEEKLSKEVEEKENQRKKEKEWMERVEDEFRKQREKEKTSKPSRMLDSKENNQSNRENENGRRKNQTGMSKWLRHNRTHSEVRPEPEGGRSSGDEKQVEQKNRSKQRNTQTEQFVTSDYYSNSEKISDLPNEDYDDHGRIRRTGSGQTFQSHTYVVERHEELYEGPKQEELPESNLVISKLNIRRNVRQKINMSETHTNKKRPSLYDSESLSDDDDIDSYGHRRRNTSGKRWKETDRSNKNDFYMDNNIGSPIGFLRNHPLRNGARVKGHTNPPYQTKGKNHLYQNVHKSIPNEKQNGYPSNRYV